jgi:hypothetical protein
MIIQLFQKHIRTITVVSGVMSWIMFSDFLLLVTSVGFHWWLPIWSATTDQFLLTCLIVFSGIYSLLSVSRIWLNVRAYRKCRYDIVRIRQIIAAFEGLLLLMLCAAWDLLVLSGHSSVLPLKLLGLVWISGFLGFVILQLYELRRRRRKLT